VRQGEQPRVSLVHDDDRRPRHRRELGELARQAPVDQAPGQVLEGRALDDGDHPTVDRTP
jgi:hypothetical protein